MFSRFIKTSNKSSFFLFGARGTGKTTWLRAHFDPKSTLWFNLLDHQLEETLISDIREFSYQIQAQKNHIEWVVVDEVQKIPALLDLVHHHIEKDKIKFALTGSSARKLKRGAANLLAGRAFVYELFPFSFLELKNQFSIDSALHFGSLPRVFEFEEDQEKKLFLRAYSQTYLQEEIIVEQIVRKLTPFRRFLQVAAQSNGQIVNTSKIAQDVQSTHPTVKTYFEILEDTHIGFWLYPYHDSFRKRLSQKAKFYFFDSGIARALAKMLDVPLKPKTSVYGEAFEHLVILEIYRLCRYFKPDCQMSYLQSKGGLEIDLVLEEPTKPKTFIEIKSTDNLREDHIKNLMSVSKTMSDAHFYCLSQDPNPKKIGPVDCLFWQDGLKRIFDKV